MLIHPENIFAPYQNFISYYEPLAKHTSFHIGGPAEIFITPKTIEQIRSLYRLCHRRRIPLKILGRGTNLLVNDRGVNNVVLNPQWFNIKRKGDERLIISAAYPLSKLINDTVKMGLSGLEPLVGIPGTMGGAVIMNAGGKYGQIADIIESVDIVDKAGRIKTLYAHKDELQFDYRYSNLKGKLISQTLIRLKSSNKSLIQKRIKEILNEKKRTQPLNAWSAGCIFKNQPCYSVGALIDRAGLKGVRVGGAEISAEHANFIVNNKNATANDVIQLINLVKKVVHKKFKIKPELEIELW
jgi:UDP-N-acetylmuramate dehydrogenase